MVPPQEPDKTMGDDTKRYLASFISDLRSKSSTPQMPRKGSSTPPPAKTAPSAPVLFAGKLSGQKNDGSAGDSAQKSISPKSKIELSDREKEMLKAFSKLK